MFIYNLFIFINMTFVMGFDFDIPPSTQKGNQCKLVGY